MQLQCSKHADHPQSSFTFTLLQSGTSDFNMDGKPDELRISMAMPLAGDEVITGVTALAWLNVQLTVSQLSFLLLQCFCNTASGTTPIVSAHADPKHRHAWLLIPCMISIIITPPLQTVARMKMDGLAAVTYSNPTPGASFVADGDLQIQQRCVALDAAAWLWRHLSCVHDGLLIC